MSVVLYVLHARPVDAGTWTSVANALRADGFEPAFTERGSSLSVASGAAGALVNFETRDSNEALATERWPAALHAGLAARPHSIFVQATGTDDDLAFWSLLGARVAQQLDGWIYHETSNELTDAYGNPPGDGVVDDDDDPEHVIDWAALTPDAAFTIICRWDRWPSLYELDAIVRALDDSFARDGSLTRGGDKHPDTERWTTASYLGAIGERIAFECQKPAKLPAYVRITFDVDEMMTARDAASMAPLVGLAQRLLASIRTPLRAYAIDLEL